MNISKHERNVNNMAIKQIRNLKGMQEALTHKDVASGRTGKDDAIKFGIAGVAYGPRKRRSGLLVIWGHCEAATNWAAKIAIAEERGEALPEARFVIRGLKGHMETSKCGQYFAVWAAPCGRMDFWDTSGCTSRAAVVNLTRGPNPCHCAACNA